MPRIEGVSTGRATLAPVLKWGGPKILGRFPPFTFESIKGRENDENHQRNLEIEIDQCQPHEGVETKSGLIQVDPKYLEQGSDHPNTTQGKDESRRKGNTGEV